MGFIRPFWLVLAALALLSTGTVRAQAVDRDAEARNLFEAGASAYTDGRYEEALRYFQRAYELSGRARLLYNVATTADRLRRDEQALETFEKYLAEEPESPRRSEVERRIRLLREQIAAERESGETAGAPGPTEPSGDASTRETASGLSDSAVGTMDPDLADGSDEETARNGLLWTYVAGGAALAFGGLAAYFWIDANNAYDDLDAKCGGSCTQELIDDSGGPRSVTLTNVFFVGSLVATAATATLLYFEWPRDGEARETEDRISLRIGPGNVLVRGSF